MHPRLAVPASNPACVWCVESFKERVKVCCEGSARQWAFLMGCGVAAGCSWLQGRLPQPRFWQKAGLRCHMVIDLAMQYAEHSCGGVGPLARSGALEVVGHLRNPPGMWNVLHRRRSRNLGPRVRVGARDMAC